MAIPYETGLRPRPPEPMPACEEGESPQDYFARVFPQCTIESATSTGNNSGDPTPTPFNLGQVQADVAKLQEDVQALEASEQDIETVKAGIASGIATYNATPATSTTFLLPDNTGDWRVVITPIAQALANLLVESPVGNVVTVRFSAPTNAGSFFWIAVKSTI